MEDRELFHLTFVSGDDHQVAWRAGSNWTASCLKARRLPY